MANSGGGLKVLVIDDEPQIRRFMQVSLTAQGHSVSAAASGEEGIAACTQGRFDVVVLDLGLPDMDGLEVITALRQWTMVPIIVLSIRASETDKIDALDRGADDYVTKPFGMGELMARIRTAVRHKMQNEGETPVFESGDLSVDVVRRQVRIRGEEAKLSRKEYDLLRVLVQHAGKVLTHQQLLREVWGPAYVQETQYLRVYIGQLRQKIEQDPARPRLIVTEPGVGYRLQDVEEG